MDEVYNRKSALKVISVGFHFTKIPKFSSLISLILNSYIEQVVMKAAANFEPLRTQYSYVSPSHHFIRHLFTVCTVWRILSSLSFSTDTERNQCLVAGEMLIVFTQFNCKWKFI